MAGQRGSRNRRQPTGPSPLPPLSYTVLMRRLSILLAFLLTASANANIVRVTVDDVIHPISAEFIGRGIDEAAQTHAELVVIELRTPGGLEESMRMIVQKILKSPVPVAVRIFCTII